MDERIGNYSFAIGVVLALILGLASTSLGPPTQALLTSILVILGIIVGFVNITGEETKEFLMSAVVLIIAAAFGMSDAALASVGSFAGLDLGVLLVAVFAKILLFTVPAVVVVALKHIWYLASTR